eukprot:4347752-Prymnesium_polylepis.2
MGSEALMEANSGPKKANLDPEARRGAHGYGDVSGVDDAFIRPPLEGTGWTLLRCPPNIN